jgi:hypothetical protein
LSVGVQRRAQLAHSIRVTASTGIGAVRAVAPLPPMIVNGVTTQRPIMMRPELEYVSLPSPRDGSVSMFGMRLAETRTPVEPVSITISDGASPNEIRSLGTRVMFWRSPGALA